MGDRKDGDSDGNWLTDKDSGCRLWLDRGGANKRVTWSGPCVDGKAHGKGTMVLRFDGNDGEEADRYEGHFRHGKIHGHGVYFWANGEIYEGDWKDGKFHGQWLADEATGCRLWLDHSGENKRVTWSGPCVDGKAQGKGTMVLRFVWEATELTDLYDGEFKRGKKHGHGIYTWYNGNRYEGDFKNSKMHGRGMYIWANGQRHEGEWKDNRPHGRGTRVSASGERHENEWTEGRSTPVPLDPEPSWALARAGRIVASGLFDLLEDDRGKLTPEDIHRLHDGLLQLSLGLANEALDVPKFNSGALDGTKVDRAKIKATWILSGFLEELENRLLPPHKGRK